MKTGYKIFVIDDDLSGIITDISSNKITFKTTEGFLYTYPKNKIVVEKGLLNHDQLKIPKNINKDINQTIKSKKHTSQSTPKFDLHIEKIIQKHQHLSNSQKLQIQLEEVQRIIIKINRQNKKEFILIHGVGKGKLRQEIVKLLKIKGFTFEEASFLEFGQGALLVKKNT